jgi:hypothetical protein
MLRSRNARNESVQNRRGLFSIYHFSFSIGYFRIDLALLQVISWIVFPSQAMARSTKSPEAARDESRKWQMKNGK